jgi:hypothetical protein
MAASAGFDSAREAVRASVAARREAERFTWTVPKVAF